MSFREKFNNVLGSLLFLIILIILKDTQKRPDPVSVREDIPVLKHTSHEHVKRAYDFFIPKEGKAQNVLTDRIYKIRRREHPEFKFPNGYTVSHLNKGVYAVTAASTSKQLYFANGYLNGFVPYKVESVWQPLELLRTRVNYQKDPIQYAGRADVWQTPRQSYEFTYGDCEDHALLLTDWLIGLGYDARIVLGEVQFRGQSRGGHAWVVLFEGGKEYILEATDKMKWNRLPLASTMPYYFPRFMFNRRDFWSNTGSVYTVRYSGKNWKKTGRFLPEEAYYPDIQGSVIVSK